MKSDNAAHIQSPTVRDILRIAFVTETYPPEVNGVANTAARFVEGLRERRHEIELVRPRQNQEDRSTEVKGFRQVLVGGLPIPRYPGLRMGLPCARRLVNLWTHCRPDVVHLVTEGPLGWSALQAARRLDLPVTSDFRTNFHAYSRHYGIGWLQKPIAAYLRMFHNRTRLTLVPTEAMRRDLAARGFGNLRVVSRGVDTGLFTSARRSEALRASWGAAPRGLVILHVGRLAPEKNLEPVIASFERIRQTEPQVKLVFVGDGPARENLQARCPDAIFAGMRTGVDLATHYASGDMFLFPSLTETFGNVTVEAMASGLAIVAYDYAAAAAHLAHGRNGVLVGYDDTAEFVRLAVALARDPARVREFGMRARQSAENLAWDCVVEKFETMLRAAAGARSDLPGAGLVDATAGIGDANL
jgi:glycosyltransferase involved in cell wall biosynthesis